MSLHHNAHGTSAPASSPNRAKLVYHGADITSVNVSLNYGIAAENIRNFVIKTGPFDRETGYSVQDRDFLERVKSLVLNNRTRKNIEILFEEYGLEYSCGFAFFLCSFSHMGTGEAPALFIQGEAGSLQSGYCAGCAAQDASPHVLRAEKLRLTKEVGQAIFRIPDVFS